LEEKVNDSFYFLKLSFFVNLLVISIENHSLSESLNETLILVKEI
jgi:hypothetical protein